MLEVKNVSKTFTSGLIRKKKIQALSKTGFACILKIVCPA